MNPEQPPGPASSAPRSTGLRHPELYRTLLETAPDALIVIDTAGEIVFANTQGERMFEYGKGELVGLIRFGSRVDVLFPAGTEATVKVGDRVKGGSTQIGLIKS